MAVKARVLFLALAVLWLVGCDTIPHHEVPDTYPAYGPTGVRTGLTFQRNFSTSQLPYWDSSDFYPEGFGGTIELPIDVNPWWGGYFGTSFEHFPGSTETITLPDGSSQEYDADSMTVIPFYVGVTGRIPYWLDKQAWEEGLAHVWLPNEPIGFAPYVRGSVGGAILAGSQSFTNKATGEDIRAYDTQIFPFFEGMLGLEYRQKHIGYWGEVGYRYYILPNRSSGPFGGERRMARMNGLRVMVGLTWYLW
jgi:hypothetical protein